MSLTQPQFPPAVVPGPAIRVIAGALWADPDAAADPLAPQAPAGAPAPSPSRGRGPRAAWAEPVLDLPPELSSWLASWQPAPLHRYAPDGPVITELAHDRWLRDWFDASSPGTVPRSPGWIAATRALAASAAPFEHETLWLAEPTHLHVATDHLILLHGAGETLTEADGEALVAAAGPMFTDAGIAFRRLDARHWLVWPLSAGPAAGVDAGPPQPPRATRPAGPPAAPGGRIPVKVVGRPIERAASLDASAIAASVAAAHGHSVEEYLPRGPAGRPLRQLFNGVQMAWHEHPVNRQRGDDGLPTINSLWFTGPTSPADIDRWRERSRAARLSVDDGPLLARLNPDRRAWALQLTEALHRAAADPSITTLVLCGEVGVLELRRPGAAPIGTGAGPGAGAGTGSSSTAAGGPDAGGPSGGMTRLGRHLKQLGRYMRQLGRQPGFGPATPDRNRGGTATDGPRPGTDPATWFREPGGLP